jgi:hypothetical protein
MAFKVHHHQYQANLELSNQSRRFYCSDVFFINYLWHSKCFRYEMKNHGKISENLVSCFRIQFQRFLNWILRRNVLSLALNSIHMCPLWQEQSYTQRGTKIWYICINDKKINAHSTLFQSCGGLRVFLETPIKGIKPQKSLNRPWYKQPSKWRITVQQRAEVVGFSFLFIFFSETKNVATTKTIFRTIFRTHWAATRNTILRLFKCFKRKRNLRVLQLCRFLKLWKNTPRKSTKKAACDYGMSQSSVPKTLRRDLKIFPPKISVLLKLTLKDTERWLQHAVWAGGIRARSIFV